MTTPTETTEEKTAETAPTPDEAASQAEDTQEVAEDGEVEEREGTAEASEGAEEVAESSEAEDPGDADGAEEANEAPAEEPDADGEAEPVDELTKAKADLDEAKEEAAKLQDRMLRVAADFENYKKRSRREVSETALHAGNRVAVDFLPVLDNLERAISHGESADEGAEDQMLLSGVKMVAKQFLGVLARHDIEPFESIGELFDPEFHEALQQIDSELPRNTVVHEMQKGYRRGDRLVRAAMVVVSKGPAEPPAEAPAEEPKEEPEVPTEPEAEEAPKADARPEPIAMPPADDDEVAAAEAELNDASSDEPRETAQDASNDETEGEKKSDD